MADLGRMRRAAVKARRRKEKTRRERQSRTEEARRMKARRMKAQKAREARLIKEVDLRRVEGKAQREPEARCLIPQIVELFNTKAKEMVERARNEICLDCPSGSFRLYYKNFAAGDWPYLIEDAVEYFKEDYADELAQWTVTFSYFYNSFDVFDEIARSCGDSVEPHNVWQVMCTMN